MKNISFSDIMFTVGFFAFWLFVAYSETIVDYLVKIIWG